MHHRSTVAALVVFSGGIAGCLDAAPVNIAAEDAGLVFEAGAVADAPLDSFVHPECRACIAADPVPGPGCGDKLQDCIVNGERCIEVYECAYARGCVTMPTFGDAIACAKKSCADDLGITDVFGPSIQKAIALTYCFQLDGPCAPACEHNDSTGALRANPTR